MAGSACHITTDLTSLVLFEGASEARWSPVESDDDASLSAAGLRQRAQAAAQWLSQQGGGAKRLSMVCVDTTEALCTWIQARSSSHQVVASAYRDQTQEWGTDASSVAVEPILSATYDANLAARQKRRWQLSRSARNQHTTEQETETFESAAADSRVSASVITLHDALVRLWLDALDQRGVRPGAVVSLWHALALAWAEKSNAPSAVIHVKDDHTLVWAWSVGGDLLTGGTVAAASTGSAIDEDDEPSEDPNIAAEHRLSLDWLSWAAHLGEFPASVTIISTKETTLGDRLTKRFDSLRVKTQMMSDPLRETLDKAGVALASAEGATNTRRCLLRLTNRPNRTVRRRYRLAAVALVLGAVALIGLGVRFQRGSAQMEPIAEAYREDQARLLARVGDDDVLNSRRPISALRALINEQQNLPDPTPPPTPLPLYEEIVVITGVIDGFEGAELATLTIGVTGTRRSQPIELRVDIDGRREQLNFETTLNESATNIEWSRQTRGGGARSLSLSGAWKTPGGGDDS